MRLSKLEIKVFWMQFHIIWFTSIHLRVSQCYRACVHHPWGDRNDDWLTLRFLNSVNELSHGFDVRFRSSGVQSQSFTCVKICLTDTGTDSYFNGKHSCFCTPYTSLQKTWGVRQFYPHSILSVHPCTVMVKSKSSVRMEHLTPKLIAENS